MIIKKLKKIRNGYQINESTCISGKIPEWVQDAINGTGDYKSKPIKVDPEFTDAELTKQTQATEKAEAKAYLESTDKWVLRKFETGKELPAGIKTGRETARLKMGE
jgi:hypothetical protein